MFKLLFSVFALTIVSGQVQAKTVSVDALAVEPEIFEDLPAVEEVPLNGTGIQATGTTANKYGVWLERVNLSNCQHYQKYLPYFYGGLVVNSRAWATTLGDERFTSMALVTSSDAIISSSSGAWPAKQNKMYHTWEMLHFGTTFQDIRETSPGTVHIQAWNAGQQIYVPLYMADLTKGRAYMLHIYPEPSFLANPLDYTYEDGLLYAKGDTNRLYKFDIDVAGLIKNLDNFSVANYRQFITAHGVIKTNKSKWQEQVVFSDVRHIDVHGLSQSSATDYICRDSVNAMDMTWTQMSTRLRRELSWL